MKDASYNLGAEWLPVSEAIEAMPPIIGLPVSAMLRRRAHGEWQQHRNISGPAGTLLVFHDRFRLSARRLLEIVRGSDGAGLVRAGRAFAPFAQTLHHHHHAEEAMLFPALATPPRLVDDHAVLMKSIARVERALVADADIEEAHAAAAEFQWILTTHLDREEELVVPLLLAMSPQDGWRIIHGA